MRKGLVFLEPVFQDGLWEPVLVGWGCKCSSCTATLMDIHASDQPQDGYIIKKVTSSSPGGQWPPFMGGGGDAVSSLSHPWCKSSLILIWRSWIQIQRHLTTFSHQIYYQKIIPKLSFTKLSNFFQLKALPYFFPGYLSTIYFWILSNAPSFVTCGKPHNFFLLPSFKYPHSLHGSIA